MESFFIKRPPISFINKFPFTKEAKDYVRIMEITPDNLLGDKYLVNECLSFIKKLASDGHSSVINFEFHNIDNWKCYALINYFLYCIGEPILWSRFAEIMRQNIEKELGDKDLGNIIRIAKNTFQWEIEKIKPLIIRKLSFDWRLKWYNYINVASTIMDESWKLVNNYIDNGWVFLSTPKIRRLIAQKVRNDVFNKSKEIPKSIPADVASMISEIKSIVKEVKDKYEKSNIFITSERRKEAYPPCINHLLNKIKSGMNLAHYERLILVFFLLNIGFTVDEVLKIFKLQPDFNEEKTKYYIKHAAGNIGGRTRYKPYNCIKIQSFEGICKKNDDPKKWCTSLDPKKQIKNPIVYYSRMVWLISKFIQCPKCGYRLSKDKISNAKNIICPNCNEDLTDLIQK